jgi:hypothetical protein
MLPEKMLLGNRSLYATILVMIHIDFTIRFQHSAEKVWDALTDWESHSRWIPLTKIIILDEGANSDRGLGTVFVGRTGIGKISFDDKMQVNRFLRPSDNNHGVGKVSLNKLNEHINGFAGFQVYPIDENNCEVLWVENITIPALGKITILNRGAEVVGEFMFRRSLKKLNKILKSQ